MLVSFGIDPTTPHTGYGYIHGGAPLEGWPGCFAVACFVEKPDARDARNYLLSGEYYWNGGIFLFSPQTFLQELATYRPDMLQACREAFSSAQQQTGRVAPGKEYYKAIQGDSIDYAVMENTTHAAVRRGARQVPRPERRSRRH